MKKTTLIFFLSLYLHSFAQDTCTSAPVITAGTYTVDQIDGTEVPTSCVNTTNATAGEWYQYTASADYTVTVTTDLPINICKDTRVHIYSGNCSNLTCIAGDDDAGVIQCNSGNANSYLSKVSFNVTAGNTYYIAFDNRWSALGFDFELSEIPIVAPVVNFSTQTISTSSNICCVVDMDGDYLDDIVTVSTNTMTIHKQKTTGGFISSTISLPGLTATPSWSIAAGDYDKNGFNDLVFGSGSRLTIVKADATGTNYTEVPYPQYIFTQRTNFVDIDNDGNLDLWACHDVAQSHSYRNMGSGDLVFDTSLMPTLAVGGNYQSMWSDYDNDGNIDMYLAKCRGGAPVGDAQRINLLYKNNGDGTYTESGALAGINDGSQSWSTAIEDFDNDGDMDFLLSNISDTNKFYLNNGDGTFTDIYATTGIDPQVGSWEIQAGDFNNDGWIDFLWQNGKEMYLNNGDLTFTGYDLNFSEGGIGDLNNDGFLDVQFGNTIYFNTPNTNHWIKINLQGIVSNRNGIGARVEIYGNWGKQIREIRSGHGFSHQSTMNAHFGIGSETTVDQVIIRWPSGIVDVIDTPNSDQALTVIEGSSPLSVANFNKDWFELYPNPSSDFISITNSEKLNIKSVAIYAMHGGLVKKLTEVETKIKINDLKEGIYIVTLETKEGKKFSRNFVKKN
ncbi:FG-GAP-like repeat-containing protein [Flavobacterium sp. J27]|uniref:FG-GAP-like repeat-containing protein n=1 Tax=Flavobacterium sp. J27 TaxID=2060419 RepID=UPI00103270EF|nr:FG-GAP-like repeat-containing protein [Flavobacterium sp. J27]